MKFLKSGLVLFISAMLATSCTPNVKYANPGNLTTGRDEIFSIRPQNRTHFIVLIKLKNPALLTTAKKVDGVVQVDRDLADIINQEQLAFIADLQALSPDIKVLYRYRLTINAVTVVAPLKYWESIRQSPKVVFAENTGRFLKPKVMPSSVQDPQNLKEFNSVKFIGAEKVHAEGIRGQGMKVGIIDTGIDFTHAMFAGPGTEEAYKSVNPSAETDLFPTAKVVGGMDFVGTVFDSASDVFEKRIPLPDMNPMDEGGHGTHVAGTVAGISVSEKTYAGVAPDALLYGLKVFGKDGSTSDEVVIAALEYAADPSGDLDLADQLNVVNMSLGSEYGTPHILYAEAIKNLSHGGTVVVASAGNAGPNRFIVGAPSVSEDAISVAASIDNAEHNWKFDAVKFVFPDKEVLSEAVESTIAQPISEAGDAQGSLMYVGLAAQDFPVDVQSALKGKVALIDRGQVTFAEKMTRAEMAGAIGVVVINNQDGAAFSMGGDGKIKIPAIMISKALGTEIKVALNAGKDVQIKFKTPEKIAKPELVDNLTDFSSQGPRSVDGLLKPEISAPGQNIISAEMGGGAKGVAMSGTSMSGPHIAGVMALLKQTHPELESLELKSLLMGTAASINNDKKEVYPVSRQGAGRVQVDKAVHGTIVSTPQGISLGQVDVIGRKKIQVPVEMRAIDGAAKDLTVSFEGHAGLVLLESKLTIAVGETAKQNLTFIVDGTKLSEQFEEVSGMILFKTGETEVFRMPILAVARQISSVKVEKLVIEANSELDSAKALTHLQLKNDSPMAGTALPFNFLGDDARKMDAMTDVAFSRECDLQSAGYRIVGDKIQFVVKIYNGVTTWNTCEVNVQFDNNGDGVADQELVGVPMDRLTGLAGTDFTSLLLDATKAREIRKEFEKLITEKGDYDEEGHIRKVDYTDSVIVSAPMKFFMGATVAMVEAPLSEIKLDNLRLSAIKISTVSVEDYSIEPDDYLGNHADQWSKFDLTPEAQGYMNLPEEMKIAANGTATVDFKKGMGAYPLMLLAPFNKGSGSLLEVDQQMLIPSPVYIAP